MIAQSNEMSVVGKLTVVQINRSEFVYLDTKTIMWYYCIQVYFLMLFSQKRLHICVLTDAHVCDEGFDIVLNLFVSGRRLLPLSFTALTRVSPRSIDVPVFLSGLFHVYEKPFNIISTWLGLLQSTQDGLLLVSWIWEIRRCFRLYIQQTVIPGCSENFAWNDSKLSSWCYRLLNWTYKMIYSHIGSY